MSAPAGVEFGDRTRWHAQIEAHAHEGGMPLLRIFSDDVTGRLDGLRGLIGVIRDRAHMRSGHVGVLIVPALEHLCPARDGSEAVTASLLGLHFGVTVQVAAPLGLEVDLDVEGDPGEQARVDRVFRGMTFGELLHGVRGDPDRAWTPSRTPAGPC